VGFSISFTLLSNLDKNLVSLFLGLYFFFEIDIVKRLKKSSLLKKFLELKDLKT
jgi:hypothetical protein